MTDTQSQTDDEQANRVRCKKDGCDKRGFTIVNIDDEMLCIDHFNEMYEEAYGYLGADGTEARPNQ